MRLLAALLPMVLASCTGKSTSDYDRALACYKTAVSGGAISTGLSAVNGTSPDADVETLPNQWKTQAFMRGAKLDKSQDEIAGDLIRMANQSMQDFSQMAKLPIDEAKPKLDSIMSDNIDCVKQLPTSDEESK